MKGNWRQWCPLVGSVSTASSGCGLLVPKSPDVLGLYVMLLSNGFTELVLNANALSGEQDPMGISVISYISRIRSAPYARPFASGDAL